jgi:hypothetical protein
MTYLRPPTVRRGLADSVAVVWVAWKLASGVPSTRGFVDFSFTHIALNRLPPSHYVPVSYYYVFYLCFDVLTPSHVDINSMEKSGTCNSLPLTDDIKNGK